MGLTFHCTRGLSIKERLWKTLVTGENSMCKGAKDYICRWFIVSKELLLSLQSLLLTLQSFPYCILYFSGMEVALSSACINPFSSAACLYCTEWSCPCAPCILLAAGTAHPPGLVLLCPHIWLIFGAAEPEIQALVNNLHGVLRLRAGWP